MHFLKYMYYMYIYTHKSFSTTLDKGLGKNIKKRGDREIGEYRLMKWKHWILNRKSETN